MQVSFRFYEELNDFLPVKFRKIRFDYNFASKTSVKDAIESLGIPHTEIDLILVNSDPADFSYNLKENDYVSVYPKFETLDIQDITLVRNKPLHNIRFILDVHLGKLAKYLRLLGFDTVYHNSYDDPEIIEQAKEENRIILTRDLGILKNNKVTNGYWLRSQDPRKQIKEVIQRFDLNNDFNLFSRCTVCNGKIKEVPKTTVEKQVPPRIFEEYKSFYKCLKCKKVYWEGSHFANMYKFIKNL